MKPADPSQFCVADRRSKPPIGLFDSGAGGLAILAEVVRLLPDHPLLYYADRAYFPYGSRPPEQVIERALHAARFLVDQGAEVIVVACNTASTVALTALRQTFDRPFVGVVPAVKPAATLSKGGRVAILATEGTLWSDTLNGLIQQYAAGVQVLPLPAPGLAACVERGDLDTPDTADLLERCLAPARAAGVDTLVLGCTHYAFLRSAIERLVGPDVAVVDPAPAVARQAVRLASALDTGGLAVEAPPVRYVTSGDPARFAALIDRLRASGTDLPRGTLECGGAAT